MPKCQGYQVLVRVDVVLPNREGCKIAATLTRDI